MNKPDDSPGPADPAAPGAAALPDGMLRVPARPSHLSLIGMFVQWYGHHAGLNDEACYELEVAVDEACTNVIQHAYGANSPGEITLRCTPLPGGLQVDILDQGKPFDPTEGGQIARQKQSRDPASGGLGLSMIRQFADDFRHRWDEQEGNRLTITKYQKG